jgi:hypothetical protein
VLAHRDGRIAFRDGGLGKLRRGVDDVARQPLTRRRGPSLRDAPWFGAPRDRGVWNDLLVIADAAAQFARSGDEAHLRNRRRGRARLREHVADLRDLTFRLLPSGIKFLTIHLAGGVLERSYVRA